MARGRLPLPDAVKEMRGTLRADRRSGGARIPTLKLVPPVPAWVSRDAIARAAWQRYARQLVAVGVLAELHLEAPAILCMLTAALRRQYAQGQVPKGAMLAQWRGLAAEFGLSPVAGQRLQVAEPEDADPFEALMRRAGSVARPGRA